MSCERCSMKKRTASTPICAMRSSSVTKSPRRLDICARSPRSMMLTNCMMISSSRPFEPPSASNAACIRRDVAVVVGAPDVDQPVEAALALVEVVGDVRREVGRLAGRALEHVVLLLAVRARAQPQRALGAVASRRARSSSSKACVHRARARRRAASPPRTRRRTRRRSPSSTRGSSRAAARTPLLGDGRRDRRSRRRGSARRARARTRPRSRPRARPRRARAPGSTRRAGAPGRRCR